MYVIQEDFEDGFLFWSNEDGWVDLASATVFSENAPETVNLPLASTEIGQVSWVKLPSLNSN